MPSADLDAIFDADRTLRRAEAALFQHETAKVIELLQGAVKDASAQVDPDEAELRLVRLSDLCAQIPGPEMADALIAILDYTEPRVRVSAGEALLDVAYDYYAEVARAIDRTLDRGTQTRALAELPFLLAEVGEPGATKQLKRFLTHGDGQVVASAIEASVQLADPEMENALSPLAEDVRDVTMDEFELETTATVGELATQALAFFQELRDG
ncbi:MAG: hypothetical protein AAGE52_18720 [Myxococcota bacterium]